MTENGLNGKIKARVNVKGQHLILLYFIFVLIKSQLCNGIKRDFLPNICSENYSLVLPR